MFLLANILILCGISCFAASLFTIQHLIKKLPLGKVRNNWQILSFFIVGFIVGLSVYQVMMWTGKVELASITFPAVSLAVAAFVLLLCFLTYQTTRDIREAIAMDQASIIDPILDIYNRRYFDRRIDEETQRSRRYKLPLSLILFDIDDYSSVKDNHGKLVAEVVLRKVSDYVVNTVRSSDIVARFDEHKIVVGTTQTDEEMAKVLADRLRSEIAKLDVLPQHDQENTTALQITVSAGVSSVLDSVKTGFDLVDITEKALQQANKLGPNNVSTYDPTETNEPVSDVIEPAAA